MVFFLIVLITDYQIRVYLSFFSYEFSIVHKISKIWITFHNFMVIGEVNIPVFQNGDHFCNNNVKKGSRGVWRNSSQDTSEYKFEKLTQVQSLLPYIQGVTDWVTCATTARLSNFRVMKLKSNFRAFPWYLAPFPIISKEN